MDFYERVKNLVKEQNLSLISFLESLGINYSSYKSAKQLNNLPRADEAVKIAKFLGTSVEYLVTGQDSNPAEIELKELKAKLKNFYTSL